MKSITEVVAAFHPNTKCYDFSRAVYKGALVRIEGIRCPIHGEFSQYSAELRKADGAGCPACGIKKRADTHRLGLDEFVARASGISKQVYDYSKVHYVNAWTKIDIICPIHGLFKITPQKHLEGQGCPACGALLRGHRPNMLEDNRRSAKVRIQRHGDSYIAEARAIHNDLYTYDHMEYKGKRSHITITCRKHGDFIQQAGRHLNEAQGCPLCSHSSSKQEEVISAYLSKYTKVIRRDRTVIRPKELDLYLPEKQIAIEYCGVYWHSSFDAEEESKTKHRHYEKYKACADLGVRLITIYDTEWQERPKTLKRLLRNAIGVSRGKLMARKCELREVAQNEAKQFFETYHPQGGRGSGKHYGLYMRDKLVACMRFSFGVNDRGAAVKDAMWTLSRYATRINVVGAASRLFKAFITEVNPREVKSFSDNRFFSGQMYPMLGFNLDADLPPDYQVWSQKLGLRAKTHYQRRAIAQRLIDHRVVDTYDYNTDPRTEAEMTYKMKAGRIYDCGKKRWVWKAVDTPLNP